MIPITLPIRSPAEPCISGKPGVGVAGLGGPWWGEVGQGLTDLITIVGVLDVVWKWWQWVQIVLPLSQQACCGEAKHEGVPSREG